MYSLNARDGTKIMEAVNGQKQQELSGQTITDLDTTFIGEHEGQIPMGLIDESQQIQATPQNAVILQSDTEPEYENESSEEDFEIKTAEQTNNSINVETQTCYPKDKNDSDHPVVGHSSKAVNTFETNYSNLDVLIFADTFLKHVERKQIGEKEHLKWNGKIRKLKDFVTLCT